MLDVNEALRRQCKSCLAHTGYMGGCPGHDSLWIMNIGTPQGVALRPNAAFSSLMRLRTRGIP